MNEFQQGTRDTIASLAHWAEDSRMVGRERWEELHRVHSGEGLPVSALARRFSLDYNTVRRYLEQSQWRPYRRAANTVTRLAEHAAFLDARAPAVNYSSRVLFQDLRRDCPPKRINFTKAERTA